MGSVRGGPLRRGAMREGVERAAHAALVGYARHFPMEKGKQRVVTALWRPLSFGCFTRRARLRGSPVVVDCDIRQHVERQIYFHGTYEAENKALWSRLARDAEVIFDVGANVGLYSLLAASANPRAAVHAFEPTSDLFARFGTNVALNGFARVTANKAGVGRVEGTAFLNHSDGVEENRGMNFVSLERGANTEESVPLVTLDGYCESRGIDRIDLMKMDIEGGEADALAGASRLLARRAIRVLFVEVLAWSAERAGHDAGAVPRALRDAGYSLWELRAGKLAAVDATARTKGDIVAFAAEPPAHLRG